MTCSVTFFFFFHLTSSFTNKPQSWCLCFHLLRYHVILVYLLNIDLQWLLIATIQQLHIIWSHRQRPHLGTLRSQMRTFWCFFSSKTPTSINNGQIEKKLYSMEANGLGFTQHVFLYTNIAYWLSLCCSKNENFVFFGRFFELLVFLS